MTADQLDSRANMLYPGPNSMSSMGEDMMNEGANKAYRKAYQEALDELVGWLGYLAHKGETNPLLATIEQFNEVLALPIQKEWDTEPPIKKSWRYESDPETSANPLS